MPDTTYAAHGHAEAPVHARVQAGAHTLAYPDREVPPSFGGVVETTAQAPAGT